MQFIKKAYFSGVCFLSACSKNNDTYQVNGKPVRGLPAELQKVIYEYLPLRDLATCEMSDKKWSDHLVVANRYDENHPYELSVESIRKQLKIILPRCFELSDFPKVSETLDAHFNFIKNKSIKHLLYKGPFYESFLQKFCGFDLNLNSLRVSPGNNSHCYLQSYETILAIVTHFLPKYKDTLIGLAVQPLSFIGEELAQLSQFSNLKSLNISRINKKGKLNVPILSLVVNNLPKLETLVMYKYKPSPFYCNGSEDFSAIYELPRLPHLKELRLSVDQATSELFLKVMPKISSLRVLTVLDNEMGEANKGKLRQLAEHKSIQLEIKESSELPSKEMKVNEL